MSKRHFNKEKDVPHGSCLAIFFRLFMQFARPYWLRLSMGVLAGLIMGGAMHAYLSFLDFGISSLESGFQQSNDPDAKTKRSIADKLRESRSIRWVLKSLNIDLEKNAEAISKATDNTKNKAGTGIGTGTDSDEKGSGIFAKINEISSQFGLKVTKDEALTFPLVCILISLMLLFFAIKAFGEFINKYFLRWVGARIVTDVRSAMFDNFQRQSVAFFLTHDVGQIISRCTNDAGTIDNAFSNSFAEMFISPIQLLVALHFVVAKAYSSNLVKPTVILLLAMPIIFIPVYTLSLFIRKYQHRVLNRVSHLTERMQENLSGIRVVKAFNTENIEVKRFNKENQKYFKSVVKSILADIFMQPTMQISAIFLGSGFIILCFHYKVSLGTLAVLGYAAQNAYKPIKELAKMNANIQKCAAAAQRIFEALDFKSALPSPPNPKHIDTLRDSIRFNNVTFTYKTDTKPVIDNVSLEIKKGQMLAVVGPTGSGKSTLANLLARFYDPDKGSITIDGINLKDIDNHDLRQLIGIVAQDTFLFNESIAFNISYGKPDATMDEIRDAAIRANAHDFIMEDPLGYNRPAGERGCMLSGGQKQRIAIARALLRNPPLLILDEATSALDTVTEQLVQQALTQLMKDRTVLAIAHRLSTIVNADKIILFDNGRILEQGNHHQLYNLNGKYRQLYDLQLAAQS